MLGVICAILTFIIFGRVLKFAIKAAWSVSKIVYSVVLLPLFLICLLINGLVEIVLPVLIIVGIISFFAKIND